MEVYTVPIVEQPCCAKSIFRAGEESAARDETIQCI